MRIGIMGPIAILVQFGELTPLHEKPLFRRFGAMNGYSCAQYGACLV
jgi:hypothetical protein